ncbi:MAG: F0F1 ATP synthase subunit B' [Nisaea sp.]|jgi:F-type H+-transporting ATPase subunit b|uniref:F0F1 ATP synthase subunit B family protein n=1 Tax=Nisaea sp. TaxID=2024842 RepID=UPI001B1D7ACF|nr:F0F1 ATP synthase subunit B' [Nisaea sp.]MBO6559322.1 F0F1 ATP synthase subunit B' [Nisaea sp.]
MTRYLKNSAAFGITGAIALAAEGALAASDGGGTLPQLDIGTFPTQVFWLFVTFIVLYIAMTKIAIPRIEFVLEERHSKLAEDLDKAGKLKADAEEVQANYEKALADARGSAHELVGAAKDEASKANAKAEAEADAAAVKKVKEAEASIEAARTEALSNVKDVVSEVAGEAVQKLIGVKVTKTELNKAVAAAMEAK